MSTNGASLRRRRPRAVNIFNIFCIEGDWWGSLEEAKSSSVRPIFDLVAQMHPRLRRIHRPVATRAEFEHYLHVWGQARHSRYPILYLAFHGSPGFLHVGDRRKQTSRVGLDEVASLLEGRCANRIVHCGSCGTVDVHKSTLNRFLRTTGASAICGYRHNVGWLEAAAFEVMLLSEMQGRATSVNGARGMDRRASELSPGLRRNLGFRFVTG